MALTKAKVKKHFPALLAAWRSLPENSTSDEQKLSFGDFYSWLRDTHIDSTQFRSVMGASEDLEMWFDRATHQSWRN